MRMLKIMQRKAKHNLKESYFPKSPSSNNDDTAAPVEGNVEDMDVTDTMSAYMSAISRNHTSVEK